MNDFEDDDYTEEIYASPPVAARREAHTDALRKAEISGIDDLQSEQTGTYPFNNDSEELLHELASRPDLLDRKLTYDEANKLFHLLAKLNNIKLGTEGSQDAHRKFHEKGQYRLNIGLSDLEKAKGLICYSKDDGDVNSFLSWSLWKPTRGNKLASMRLFVPV